MHQKLIQNPYYAKKMVRVRSKTVEPVIGTLVNFTNMKRVKALSSNKAVVRHSHLVTLTRASIRERNQKVKWIKGHADSRGNQMADTFARQASSLPPPTTCATPIHVGRHHRRFASTPTPQMLDRATDTHPPPCRYPHHQLRPTEEMP